MASVVAGNRGGKILIYNGYRYNKNKQKGGKIYWRCCRKTCKAYLQTASFDIDEDNPDIHILRAQQHKHADDKRIITSSSLTQRMIDKILDDPTRPIKQIYDEVVRDAGEDDHIPNFDHVRSKLHRIRAALVPPILRDVVQVIV